MNLEKKIEPKTGPLRRNSTGNSSIQISHEQKPITPNYLRASIGYSCHDFCKYGIKRDFQPKSTHPKQDENVKTVLEESSGKDHRQKKVLAAYTKTVPVSSRQKLKPFVTSAFIHQPSMKQPIKTLLKSSSNIRISRNDAVKDIKNPKTSSKSSFLTLNSPTAKIRTSKSFPRKISQSKIKKPVEKSETEKTSYENVPEKIIHVIEPKDENRKEGLAQESYNCTAFTTFSSNQNKKMDLTAENRRRAIRVSRVVPEEKDISPKKLKFRRGRVLEIENGNSGSIDKSLRRLVSDKEFINKKSDSNRGVLRHHQAVERKNRDSILLNTVIEETASQLVKMRKSKVKALVGAFESVIKIQDSESPRTSTTF
ncbi:hypothetical protein DH2020_013084 [Rehmannia glutinosa]|uniref:Calmodulin-binding domain-containing protein n=1 Tax=Rehmannia glutinosa TaxID=99300 RepID=A0ABR0X4S5_REHGL